ncbi:copper-binding protein [Sphingomonas sp. TX0543]|uniref:copper-binding protein n=1 Tax=Sphingomonas sp. TX0543 TaxID=3399682 RepID=UPI003AFB4DA9
MRIYLTVMLAFGGLSAAPVIAQTMSDMKAMPGMAGMDHPAPAAKTGQGTGVITAIDTKANTLTIRHGAIPSVSWPAMTMTFKASSPTLLHGLSVGQTIGFDVRTQGMAAEVTAVRTK